MKKFILIVGVLAVLIGVAFTAYTTLSTRMDQPKGFTVLVNEGGSWKTLTTISYDLHYTDKTIDLGAAAPDANGNVVVRVAHGPEGMANIDSAALIVSGTSLTPKRVVDAESSTDLMRKLAKNDNDVINAQGKTIEFTYTLPRSARTASPLQLTVRGREENPNNIPGGPCTYTASTNEAESPFEYVLGTHKGAINVDGVFTADDRLDAPFFKEFTKPISGHPDGYTYGWIKNDDQYLYGAVDFTSDNTFDGTADFSAIQIKTNDGWKEFKVSVGNEKWGKPGFIYTDSVSYQHKVYEFKIPLSELGVSAQAKVPLQLKFSAYGTASCADDAVVGGLGANNPGDRSIFIGNDSVITSIQLIDYSNSGIYNPRLTCVKGLTVTAEGTGNDATDIAKIYIYKDVNSDGQIDAGDIALANGTFSADNGTSSLSWTNGTRADGICTGISDECGENYAEGFYHAYMLIAYEIKPSAASGATFRSSIVNENAFSYTCFECNLLPPCDCTGITPKTTGMFNNSFENPRT